MSLLQNLGRLRPETDAQRQVAAKIGEADVAECRARAEDMTLPGRLLDKAGNVQFFPASEAIAMLEATRASNV